MLLAGGWLATTFLPAAAPPASDRAARRRARRGDVHPPPTDAAVGRRLAQRALAAAVLGIALWTLAMSGSMGAAVGLLAGGVAAAVLLGIGAKSRRARRAVYVGLVLMASLPAALGSVLAWRAAIGDAGRGPVFDVRLLDRITSPASVELSMGSRLDNWRTGIDAFLDRPVLGWGPGNYLAASGRHSPADFARHLPGKGAVNEGRDHAHNMLIEEAATKGVVGLAAYLALWLWTARVVVGSARRAQGAGRVMVACVGGVLAGWFVQSQTFFYSPSAWLVHMLLIAWLARCEAPPPPAAGDRRPAPRLAWALGVAAVAVAAASLVAHRGVHAGAAALHRAAVGSPDVFMAELEASILAFEPLATHNRILLFENVAPNWQLLRSRYTDEAFRLLAWCDREAPKALAAEPANWQLHHALAHLYREVARTEPEYAEVAERYARSAREVAPNMDPMLPMNYATGGK